MDLILIYKVESGIIKYDKNNKPESWDWKYQATFDEEDFESALKCYNDIDLEPNEYKELIVEIRDFDENEYLNEYRLLYRESDK